MFISGAVAKNRIQLQTKYYRLTDQRSVEFCEQNAHIRGRGRGKKMSMTTNEILRADEPRKPRSGPENRSTIAVSAAIALARDLNRQGVDGMAVLHRAGLKSTTLNDKYCYIPLSGMAKALELAAVETNDYCTGLHFGEYYEPTVSHACGYAIQSAPNLRGALTSLATHRNTIVNIPTQFGVRGAMALFSWSFGAEIDAPEQITALTAMRTLKHIQKASGQEWRPLAVNLTFDRPEKLSEYHRLLGPNIKFGQCENSFLIEPEILSMPMPAADPDLYEVARSSFMKPILGTLDDDNPVDRVRRFITERLGKNGTTLEATSKHMGMTPQHLRRVLNKHNTCYQCIVDETRKSVAEYYLTQTDMRFSEIAYLLRFSDQSAFTRAVKRWFSMTPKDVRRNNYN